MDQTSIIKINLADIDADPAFNCRNDLDIGGLVESLNRHGQLYPVDVQALENGRYRLLAGFRRYACCCQLKTNTIDARVRTIASETDAQLLNLLENLARKDLNILEEAKAVDRMFSPDLSERAIAMKVDRSREWVHNRRCVMNLPEIAQQALLAGQITLKQAVHISKADNKLAELDLIINGPPKPEPEPKPEPAPTRDVKGLITTLLDLGFNPNLIIPLAWAVGMKTNVELAEAISFWEENYRDP